MRPEGNPRPSPADFPNTLLLRDQQKAKEARLCGSADGLATGFLCGKGAGQNGAWVADARAMASALALRPGVCSRLAVERMHPWSQLHSACGQHSSELPF